MRDEMAPKSVYTGPVAPRTSRDENVGVGFDSSEATSTGSTRSSVVRHATDVVGPDRGGRGFCNRKGNRIKP
jgi:hypothetical protein